MAGVPIIGFPMNLAKKGPGVLCPVFLQLESEILLNYFSRFLDVEERRTVCHSQHHA